MTKAEKEYSNSLNNFVKSCENNIAFAKRAISNREHYIALSRKRIALELETIRLETKRVSDAKASLKKLSSKK